MDEDRVEADDVQEEAQYGVGEYVTANETPIAVLDPKMKPTCLSNRCPAEGERVEEDHHPAWSLFPPARLVALFPSLFAFVVVAVLKLNWKKRILLLQRAR